MTQPDTRQRIIDAAEELFAEKGFHHTTMRAITSLAQVNLAAVNYHFGSKEALLQEVFDRHVLPLNKERQRRLNEIRSQSKKDDKKPEVRAVLDAFIGPTLKLRDSGPSARNFLGLVGRALSEPDEAPRRIFFANMRTTFELLFDILCEALPDLPPGQVYWRLLLSLSSISQVVRGHNFSDALLPHVDTDPKTNQLEELLLDFVTRGMEGIN